MLPQVGMKTSEYLQAQLNSLTYDVDFGDDLREADPAAVESERLMKIVRSALLESLETVSSEDNEGLCAWLRDYPDACADMLDDHISKLLVGSVPEMVRRLLRFQPIVGSKVADKVVNVYLSEAMRSYLYGHFQAAVALSRAALEQALRATVPYALAQGWTLDALIDAAGRFRVLDPAQLQMATEVQHAGNRVLHGTACDDKEAFDILVKGRGVVEALFGKPA